MLCDTSGGSVAFTSAFSSNEAVTTFCKALMDAVREESTKATAQSSTESSTRRQEGVPLTQSSKSKKETQRLRLGRELRSQLMEVVRLPHQHKTKEADQMTSTFQTATAAAAERAKKSGLTKRRALELRYAVFSFGRLQLTRDAVSRFREMPEVKELMRDNQNKHRIRVDLGTDPRTGEKLYDIHDRRAQLASTNQLLEVFHHSEYAMQLREATKTATRPNGVKPTSAKWASDASATFIVHSLYRSWQRLRLKELGMRQAVRLQKIERT
ncbi:MAG: hypothetical protein SGPRY_013135 [Prymnesium sp.]